MMRSHLPLRHAVIAGAALAALAILCLSPSLLGDRVGEAVSGLDAAEPGMLWLAGCLFALMSVCGAHAWRAALRASGSLVGSLDATARLVGSRNSWTLNRISARPRVASRTALAI